MDDPSIDARGRSYTHDASNYELSGKIMVSAIIVLFTVLLFILCLHVYARCFLLRRRREDSLRRRRRAQFVFVAEGSPSVHSQGLDASVLRSIPSFVYSPDTHKEPLECAVCLSEFQEKEKGRCLPKCNHSFHIECIDMWFHSHSTCPLCRSAINLEAQQEIAITIEGEADSNQTASNSGFCESCRHLDETAPSSSSSSSSSSSLTSESAHSSVDPSSSKTKPQGFNGIRLEVPKRRSESFTNLELELSLVSPGGQGLKSPGGRILSLKRILNREMRFSPTALSCASGPGIDLERGGEEQGGQLQR